MGELKLNFIYFELHSGFVKTDIVETEGAYRVQHTLDNDYCGYCNIILTPEISVVFDVCSNDYEDTKVYCKPCARIFLKDINMRICEGNGIRVCYVCGLPKKKGCKCKFDTKLKKQMK